MRALPIIIIIKTINRITLVTLAAVFISGTLPGCERLNTPQPDTPHNLPPYTSFRDIPGVTEDEIKAVEIFQAQGVSFVYGTVPSTETFLDGNGEIRGFTALFCAWLSELFGIPFKPAIYEWSVMLEGLESGLIDFTGELTAAAKRRNAYIMTNSIAERMLKYLRIANSPPLSYIAVSRPLRYAFLSGTTTIDEVSRRLTDDYETFIVSGYKEAYQLLKSGQIDAFIDEGTAEEAFDVYGDVVAEDFYPRIYGPVSLATQKKANEPIISVVQKALRDGGRHHLARLYNRGTHEYKKRKLQMSLTPEEKAYLNRRAVVWFAAEHDNYPMSFYNRRDKGFQGICFDVLNEVEALTGLRFELLNDQLTDWVGIIKMLEDGKVSMISELIRSPERTGRFLWPEAAVLTDNPALLSKLEFRNININEVSNMKVGLIKGYAHSELFDRWFPDHENTVRYGNFDQAFVALSRGEVDVMMGSQNQLLVQTNFRELPGYKANVVFDFPFESTFGFNKDEAVLCSIMSKAMRQIDTKGIAGQWTRRTYDYRKKLAESRLPWLFGVIVLLFLVLILSSALFFKKRKTERTMLEVRRREQEHEAEKTMFDRLNRMKTEFLGNISHELKTPLSVISSHAQLTRQHEQANELPDDYVINKMLLVSSEAERTAALVEQLLDITCIEEGRLSLTLKRANIGELIKAMVNTFYPVLNKNNNKIVIEPLSDACDVLCDRQRVTQVLLNLLSNAVRFTRNGTITIKAQIEEAGFIAVSVNDTGSGIPKERLPYIFDRYYTEKITKGGASTGTGLGLYISKHLIKEHGGTISLTSESGIGTKATFTLPTIIQTTEADDHGE